MKLQAFETKLREVNQRMNEVLNPNSGQDFVKQMLQRNDFNLFSFMSRSNMTLEEQYHFEKINPMLHLGL